MCTTSRRYVVSQAHEGMDALNYNLRQEHVVLCDFISTFNQVCKGTEGIMTNMSHQYIQDVNVLAMKRYR